MQKVVYSVTKVNNDERKKGVGYLIDGNLLIPDISGNGNPYIRIFEDVTTHCHKIVNSENDYKGYVTIGYKNIQVYNEEKKRYDTLDYIETTYSVWYKFIDWGDDNVRIWTF